MQVKPKNLVKLDFDLSLLTIFNNGKIKENDNLIKLTRNNLQILLNKIYKLPKTNVSQSGIHVKLPNPTVIIPKEKTAYRERFSTSERFKKNNNTRRKQIKLKFDETYKLTKRRNNRLKFQTLKNVYI